MTAVEGIRRELELKRVARAVAGWNRTGSNLLATAALLARDRRLFARRSLLGWDVFVILVTFVFFAFFAKFSSDVMFLHAILSISYLMRKMNKVTVEFIIEDLERSVQKVLVLRLFDLCQAEGLDHEDIGAITVKIAEDQQFCDKVLDILQRFIHKETKFTIL
jgi:hypothetical protein